MPTIRTTPLNLAHGRKRPHSKLVEFTVLLPPEEAEALRTRAALDDRSISSQIRRDIAAANRRH